MTREKTNRNNLTEVFFHILLTVILQVDFVFPLLFKIFLEQICYFYNVNPSLTSWHFWEIEFSLLNWLWYTDQTDLEHGRGPGITDVPCCRGQTSKAGPGRAGPRPRRGPPGTWRPWSAAAGRTGSRTKWTGAAVGSSGGLQTSGDNKTCNSLIKEGFSISLFLVILSHKNVVRIKELT